MMSDRKIALALVLGAAPLALQSAMAQDAVADTDTRVGSIVRHSWSLDSSIFYTDNFRRLPDNLTRQNLSREVPFLPDPVTGLLQPVTFAAPDQVSVETPDNTVLTGTISGSTLIRRPFFSGLLSGAITIGSFLNTEDLDQRLLDSAVPGVPATDEFDIPGLTDPQTLDVAGATFGLPDRGEAFVDPNIRAAGTFRLIDNLFYLDVGALVQEQNLGFGGVVAQEGVGQAGDEIVYGGVSVSPYLFRQFADDSTVEVRFRATAIDVLREDIDLSRDGRLSAEDIAALEDAQIENDSRSFEAVAEYTSGQLLDRLSFQAGAFARTVDEDGSDLETREEVKFTQASGSFDVAYGVSRALSLTAGVGVDDVAFDDIDIAELTIPNGATPAEIAALQAQQDLLLERQADQAVREDELSGLFWRVGFVWTPSRKSKVEMTVGERFGGTAIEGEASYRPSPRVRVSVGATRQIDSALQDFASSALQFQSQAFEVLTTLAEGQTGTASALLDRALSFQGSSFRDVQRGQTGFAAFNRYRAAIQGDFRRTNFGASLQYSENDLRGQDATLLSAEADIARQITRRFSINGRLRYSLDEGSLQIGDFVGVVDNTLPPEVFETKETLVSLGAAYQLGTKLSLTGQVYRIERDADEALSGTQFDYEENAIGLGLRWVF